MPEDLFSEWSDATIYFVIGSIGLLLMIIRVVVMLLLGVDSDVDFDADGGDIDGGGDGFGLLSVFSVLAFLAGFGWVGYAARVQWEWGPGFSALAGAAFGFVMMLLAASMMFYLRKLNSSGGYDPANAVGKIAKAYLTIPADGKGLGEVQVNFDGNQRILPAKSRGPKIESFTTVRIVEIEGDETAIVEPVD